MGRWRFFESLREKYRRFEGLPEKKLREERWKKQFFT